MKIQTKLGRTRTDTDQRILIYIYTIVICTLNAYRCWTKTIAVIMSDKAMLVLGEAPESDDEDQVIRSLLEDVPSIITAGRSSDSSWPVYTVFLNGI